MLGRKVYYLNFKDNLIGEGVIIEAHISTGGYESYILQTDKGDVQVEKSICYTYKDVAEKALLNKQPISEKMNAIAKKATSQIDNLRIRLLGKPKLKHLARK